MNIIVIHITLFGRYEDAEKDCCLALALDDSYVKAYFRRATARVKLGKLEEAKLGTSVCTV